jgi:hypothetical protein
MNQVPGSVSGSSADQVAASVIGNTATIEAAPSNKRKARKAQNGTRPKAPSKRNAMTTKKRSRAVKKEVTTKIKGYTMLDAAKDAGKVIGGIALAFVGGASFTSGSNWANDRRARNQQNQGTGNNQGQGSRASR